MYTEKTGAVSPVINIRTRFHIDKSVADEECGNCIPVELWTLDCNVFYVFFSLISDEVRECLVMTIKKHR